MILWVLGGVALALVVMALGFGWWGAGLILHPPKMSALAVWPEQFGLSYEKVSFQTSDGLTLKGWFLPSPTGDERTLLMCHGWGDNKGELLELSYFLNKNAGFNLLYFDNRSHGESEGRVTTIGYLELIDFEAAVQFLKENKPWSLKRLGVFGLSMGAAVAIMSMPAHPEIKAAVLESPFTDYRGVVRRWAWNNMRLPYFPCVVLTLWFLRQRVGKGEVDGYSPIQFIGRVRRPVLLIGGGRDDLMIEEEVRALYAAAGEPKEIWIVPQAEHAKCHETAGIEYENRVAGFFEKHL